MSKLARPRLYGFLVIAWAFVDAFGAEIIPFGEEATRTGELGEAIFASWVIPFEVVSFVLLAALVGGIAIARQDQPEEGSQ